MTLGETEGVCCVFWPKVYTKNRAVPTMSADKTSFLSLFRRPTKVNKPQTAVVLLTSHVLFTGCICCYFSTLSSLHHLKMIFTEPVYCFSTCTETLRSTVCLGALTGPAVCVFSAERDDLSDVSLRDNSWPFDMLGKPIRPSRRLQRELKEWTNSKERVYFYIEVL